MNKNQKLPSVIDPLLLPTDIKKLKKPGPNRDKLNKFQKSDYKNIILLDIVDKNKLQILFFAISKSFSL